MNKFVLLSVFLVVFTYYGGKYVPNMLKDNKQVLLGFAVALLLCSFFKKDLVEGYYVKASGMSRGTCMQSPTFRVTSGGILHPQHRPDLRDCEDVTENGYLPNGMPFPNQSGNVGHGCWNTEKECNDAR